MLKKIQAAPLSKDLVYLSISIDKNATGWQTAEQKLSIPWRSLLADELTVDHYNVKDVPNYIVTDKTGTIVSRGVSLGNLYAKLKELQQ